MTGILKHGQWVHQLCLCAFASKNLKGDENVLTRAIPSEVLVNKCLVLESAETSSEIGNIPVELVGCTPMLFHIIVWFFFGRAGAVLVLGYCADVVAATYPGASLLGVKQEGTHLEFSAEHRFLLCLISRN